MARAEPRQFVRYDTEGRLVEDANGGYTLQGDIVAVDEFQVAAAILGGELELLSQEIDSQHLFTLCCRFGLHSTAAAMMTRGVRGCVLEAEHLEPFRAPRGLGTRAIRRDCECGSRWKTCRSCCWGFDFPSGVWMSDWSSSIQRARGLAFEVASRPLFRAVSEAFCSGNTLPNCLITRPAMARLIDVAILTGDAELAAALSAAADCRPLRRWRWQDLIDVDDAPFLGSWRVQEAIEVCEPGVIKAAVAAGAAFEGLVGCDVPYQLPFREALALCDDRELWDEVKWKMAAGSPHAPGTYNNLSLFLCTCSDLDDSGRPAVELSAELLQAARDDNLLLEEFAVCIYLGDCPACGRECGWTRLTLLDCAILRGQAAAAELCASINTRTSWWTRWLSLEPVALACVACGSTVESIAAGPSPPAPLVARKAAAAAALQMALRVSKKQAGLRMGVPLLQAMRSWARGKSVSAGLVDRLLLQVLDFAVALPAIALALRGCEGELLSCLEVHGT